MELKYRINTGQLIDAVNALDLDFEAGFDEIEYKGLSYRINYVDDHELDCPGRCEKSTSGHFHIEISVKRNLGEEEIRRTIIHEVIEADLHFSQRIGWDEAHRVATVCHQKYRSRSRSKIASEVRGGIAKGIAGEH